MSDTAPIPELAALASVGWLDPQDQAALDAARKSGSAGFFTELARAQDVGALFLMAKSRPAAPPPELKEQILARISRQNKPAESQIEPPLQFIVNAADGGWIPMKVPGAYARMLSANPEKGYAVLLGKLDAGARYPGHVHQEQEDVYILQGDLHIGQTHLKAGDFHRAAKGSAHDVNWSDGGCVIMLVMSLADLQAQFAAG